MSRKTAQNKNVTFILISLFVFWYNVSKQRGIKNIFVLTKNAARQFTFEGKNDCFLQIKTSHFTHEEFEDEKRIQAKVKGQ